MALSLKHRTFVDAYFECFNASEAARRAGYSERSRGIIGHRLIKKAKTIPSDEPIAVYYRQCLDEQTMSADEAKKRLGEQARAEYAEYIEEDGTVDLARMKRENKMHLIKGIKETQHGREVTFYDAQSALVHIGKAHGLFAQPKEEAPSDDAAGDWWSAADEP